MNVAGAANLDFVVRRAHPADRDLQALGGKPHLDMLHQCKLLPSHCEVKFTFQRSPANFYMMQTAALDYFVKIKKPEMTLRQVQVRDEVAEVHNKAVHNGEMGPFNFPISRGNLVKHMLTQGSLEYTFNLPDTTQIPTNVVLGFVKETASSGTKTENPYNFQHYNVRDIVLQFDDQKFHVQTAPCEDALIHLLLQGKLNFNLMFGTVLHNPVSVIVYAVYDNLIQLTVDRIPVTDFGMV